MGKVINLNRFRKKKAAEERRTRAEQNRVLHGRTRAERERQRREQERAHEQLEGHKLEPSSADDELEPDG